MLLLELHALTLAARSYALLMCVIWYSDHVLCRTIATRATNVMLCINQFVWVLQRCIGTAHVWWVLVSNPLVLPWQHILCVMMEWSVSERLGSAPHLHSWHRKLVAWQRCCMAEMLHVTAT